MLTTTNDNSDLFEKVITGDEFWVYGYDKPKRYHPNGSFQESRNRKSTSSSVNVKVLLTVFVN